MEKRFSRAFNQSIMAGFSESMRRDICGQGQLFVDNQCQVLEKMNKTPEDTSTEIDELQAALTNEEREIEEMEMDLMMKKQQIEEMEGMSIEDLAGAAHKPGACKVSPVAMDWMGQHRMLTDWKELYQQRKAELNILRDSMSDR
jgi:TolA-binding protein